MRCDKTCLIREVRCGRTCLIREVRCDKTCLIMEMRCDKTCLVREVRCGKMGAAIRVTITYGALNEVQSDLGIKCDQMGCSWD